MINWKVRIKNKYFWLAAIPSALLIVEAVAKMFGYEVSLSSFGDSLLDVVRAVFAFLALLGITNDPTTAGLTDSKLAMTYDVPKEDYNG